MTEPSVDVLAAQVRSRLQHCCGEFGSWDEAGKDAAEAALDALVARVTEAEQETAYAWSCAEDMKEWAKRADDHLRGTRASLAAELRGTNAALADARNALERLANPMGEPKTEEAALYAIEVEQIAFEVLARLDGNQP